MQPIKPGDVVLCRIKDGFLVSCYSSFDEERDFQIIGTDEAGHYLYIPDHISIKDTFKIDAYSARVFAIAKQFIDCRAIYISPSYVCSVKSRLDGLSCIICNEFSQYAEANNEDGSLTCFICRSYHWFR